MRVNANNSIAVESLDDLSLGRRVLARAQTLLRTCADKFPFTTQGICVFLAAIIALQQFAYARMDLVVFAIAICALAIIGFTAIIVILGGLILRHRITHQLEMRHLLTRTSAQVRVETGYPNETGFTLDTMVWLPLISVHWSIVAPNQIETHNKLSLDEDCWEEEIRPLRRCKTDTITRRFVVRDVLGFCQFSWRFTQDAFLTALPRAGKLKQLPILRSLTAEDGIPSPSGHPEGDRMEIRPYAMGDSVRNIMWGAYARTRHLNVRLPERSVFHSHRTLAYLISSPKDEAASAVARVAVETGALGDEWVLGADGSNTSTDQIAASLELIAGSRALTRPHSFGLDTFLQTQGNSSATYCVIFAGTDIAPLLPLLTTSTARYQAKICLVLATDGFTDESVPSPWRGLFYRAATNTSDTETSTQDQSSRTQLSRLLTDVGHLVESILIVDRSTGQCFDARLKRL
jgi:hypothetical protein